MADVLIAGGGPAGATLAILLGRAGLRVDLFDAHRFPREKPCGEGLMPAGVAVLRRLGLADAAGGRPLHGVRYHGWGLTAEAPFPSNNGVRPTGLGQRRLLLDQALFSAAEGTPGVRVFPGVTVAGALIEDGRAVGLQAGEQQHRAPLVVGADGPLSPVRKSLGLDGPRPRRLRLGVRTHFRLRPGTPQPNLVEVFLGDGHELYVTPLPDDEVLVAALCEQDAAAGAPRQALARWIDAQPILRERLTGALSLTPLAGRAPLALPVRRGFAAGAVLLGDAAGFIDPITGGGMAQALITAELLAAHVPRILSEGLPALARFDRQRQRLLRDYQRLTRLLLLLTRWPIVARSMLRLMQHTPRTMSHLIGVAGGMRRLIGGPAGQPL
jgi:flavin-dependent dehydrogenase